MKEKRKGFGSSTKPLNNEIEPERLSQQRDKNSHFPAQMKVVFQAFDGPEKTMLQVSVETGILRANICRYVAEWLENNLIQLVRMGFCPISLHRAGRYSTNPAYWEKEGAGC